MKDYYCYDFRGNHIRSFDSEQTGRAWIDDQIRQWRELGRKGIKYRLCYNGSASTELYSATS